MLFFSGCSSRNPERFDGNGRFVTVHEIRAPNLAEALMKAKRMKLPFEVRDAPVAAVKANRD